jgi:CheY-like chemotaxis protein
LKQDRSQPITSVMESPRRIAHDLNNVAFVISGYAQQIEESLGPDHELQPDVQQILAEIPRLTAIVERIRSLDPVDAATSSELIVGDTIITEATTHKRRILLVEDEAAVRDLLRQALERRGYHVDIGATGAEGLALCDELDPPDLLITDLILPGATGPVIVERLRRRAPEVKVLLMSGYAEHPLLDAAHAAGEPCLVKPFEITAFNETVARLLAA